MKQFFSRHAKNRRQGAAIFLIVSALALCACSTTQVATDNTSTATNNSPRSDSAGNPEKFKTDQAAFINSLELFKTAQKSLYGLLEKYRGTSIADPNEAKKAMNEYDDVYKKYKAVIAESETISDAYLDSLHPQFRSMYREKFIASVRLTYESGIKKDATGAEETDRKVNEMLESFWRYLASIQNDIRERHPEIEQALVRILSD